jgi:hypothetical protein
LRAHRGGREQVSSRPLRSRIRAHRQRIAAQLAAFFEQQLVRQLFVTGNHFVLATRVRNDAIDSVIE